jgi:benzoate membrane transport protein
MRSRRGARRSVEHEHGDLQMEPEPAPLFDGHFAQVVFAGLLAAMVAYASSVAIIVQGLTAMGASPSQVGSGLLTLNLCQGVCAIYLSLRLRMPIAMAWSTPGAALLASTGLAGGDFSTAVGAFLVAGLLCVLAGLWRQFGLLVSSIPRSLANAMVAGILLTLCLAPFTALAKAPRFAVPVVLAWVIAGRIKRLYAVPTAVIVAAVVIAVEGKLSGLGMAAPHLDLVAPTFSATAMISIAIPLFVVTMASQNIPGLAVLNANGYRPAPGPLFIMTGTASVLGAPFGSHGVNLAAITAALCVGPDSHPDPSRRYISGISLGVGYILLGLLSTIAADFIQASPPMLIQAVAGLALLGAFGSSLAGALAPAEDRDGVVVTLVASASSLTFLGIGAAFWGLLGGMAMLALHRGRPARR